MAEWREEGKADIVPGVLFIDEARTAHCVCMCTCHALGRVQHYCWWQKMPAKECWVLSSVASKHEFCCVKA